MHIFVPKMKILDLCSGSKSIQKAIANKNVRVISIDINPIFDPTYVADVTDITFFHKTFKPGEFHFVWASPPCTTYSKASNIPFEKRPFNESDKVVKACINIINYLRPLFFCLENPEGHLRLRPFMQKYNHLLKKVNYCKYGFPYRKPTHLWTNVPFEPKVCRFDCDQLTKDGTHKKTVQSGCNQSRKTQKSTSCLMERYSIPALLIKDIINSITVQKHTKVLQTTNFQQYPFAETKTSVRNKSGTWVRSCESSTNYAV